MKGFGFLSGEQHPGPLRRAHLISDPEAADAEQTAVAQAMAAEAAGKHAILGTDLYAEVPAGHRAIFFAFGCYWGAEKLMWSQPNVWVTEVGFMGGHTTDPTYRQVCTGMTGHAETVRVVFDIERADVAGLITQFFENHDPTQVNRQGNDIGSQYRSAIWTTDDGDLERARAIAAQYQRQLSAAGYGAIATEIAPATTPMWFAHPEHQQYLAKNPHGYCPLHATGVQVAP